MNEHGIVSGFALPNDVDFIKRTPDVSVLVHNALDKGRVGAVQDD